MQTYTVRNVRFAEFAMCPTYRNTINNSQDEYQIKREIGNLMIKETDDVSADSDYDRNITCSSTTKLICFF